MTEKYHDLKWMLDDALKLNEMNRKFSTILLLLCAIDAISKRTYPGINGVRERFEKYLTSKMRRPGRPQIHNIEVPQKGKFYTFEYLIYKFLRNPFVHEGVRLEKDHQDDYAVCIDWDVIPNGLKIDPDNKRVILGGELVLNILIDAVQEGIGV